MVLSQRSYVWYLKSYTNGVIPTYEVVSIKNARFKSQPSTPMQAFASIRSTHFMKIDDKEGGLYKDMKALREFETKK